MSIDSVRGVINETALLLAPLVEAANAPENMLRLLGELGWDAASVPRPLTDLGSAGADLLDAIAQADELPVPRLLAAIAKLVAAIDAIRMRPDTDFPSGIDIAAFRQTIGGDLLDHCAVEYLLRHRFRIGRLLKLTGIVRLFEVPANGGRRAYVKRFVDWAGAGRLLTDPVRGFREAYEWDSAAPRLTHLLSDVGGVLEAFGLDLSHFVLGEQQLAFVAAGATPQPAGLLGLSLDLNQALGVPPGGEAGMQFAVRPATATRGPAIAVLPFARLVASSAAGDDTVTTLAIRGSADLAQGFAITLLPGNAPVVERGFLGSTATTAPADLALELRVPPPPGAPERVLVGAAEGSRMSLHTAAVAAGVALASGQEIEAFVELKLDRLRVVIDPAEADGLIANLLGRGVSTELSLALRLSSSSGLHIGGGVGLQGSFPVALQLGPVGVRALTIGLKPRTRGVDLDVGATLVANLGPVAIVTDGTGFRLAARFPDPPTGNLGPVDVAFGFLPPSGIGLSVDAHGVLTGGGFLFHDAAQGLYAGAMQLSLREQITLKAFGLIATRMPDGSRGYSLIVFITAEDFRPIPLGLGFTLLGIGGMVGVNRTFDQDVLRQGLKNGTLATLLFPRDPIGNAPTLIRSLASAFPARRDSYLLGILAKIGWFTPTLVLMDLALILEFGSRERLLALGRISALLPSADNDLVRLNMEAMGVIDFDAGTAAIDAVLVDSRLAHKFPITGSAALRAGFGTGPSFVLSVGGFNPRFAAPATVPALNRVAIALSSGNNPRLICEAYFAITSNTVQFGAHASLYAGAGGFSVEGAVGFDVLVQLFPLHFIADFHAKLQLKRGSHNLFMVKLEGSLEGPRPLRVSGKATFEILWCDFSVRFDTTLVKGERPPLPPAVNVLAELTQALASPSSWSTQRSATQTHGVALRSLPPASPTAPIVLDPLGQVLVKQQVVPLNTARDIDTFGGAPVAGERRFVLTAALNNGTPLSSASQRAPFAPAQFFEMSDDEKLAAPSFESMDAGCVFGDAGTVFDPTQVIPAPLEYKPISITLEGAPATVPSTAAPAPYTLSATQLQAFTRSGAAARAPVRHVGRARFRNDSVEGAASFAPKRWKIMPNGEGPAATVDPAVRTWSEYQGALKALNRGGARWQVVPAHEIED